MLLQAVKLVNGNAHEVLGVGSGSFNSDSEEAGVREVGVSGANSIDEVVALSELDSSSSAVSV